MIHGNKHVQSALVESSWGATRKKNGYLNSFYRKLVIKKGSKKSLIAVSHKQIKATYHILKNKEAYKEPTAQIDKANERNRIKNIKKSVLKLRELGYDVRLTPTA